MNNTVAMWISIMLILAIGLVAAQLGRSYKMKKELQNQQILNDAVKHMNMSPVRAYPCKKFHCQDV